MLDQPSQPAAGPEFKSRVFFDENATYPQSARYLTQTGPKPCKMKSDRYLHGIKPPDNNPIAI